MSKHERAALFICVCTLLIVCLLSFLLRHNTPQPDKIPIQAVNAVGDEQYNRNSDTCQVEIRGNTRKKKRKPAKQPYQAPPRRDYRNEPIN